ncbi:peptidoglycan DD-metalloendopeptidase family protein [Vibrio sp. 10N.261.55.A7]|uniref:peptidoglycan DD-metalloendopeptidase family protein n=1 Tax=Vibrio sp. 10N.261.55.A7 TaxID=1880851 RepID=UPI000C856BF3|nr:peptidoglycan DD-metalloendopeptidase family protein [Vibrio sp. 10N.261.55.A7]PMJ96233.1 peptidase M23 [Vibrio sp. 10N.261.55.A7]
MKHFRTITLATAVIAFSLALFIPTSKHTLKGKDERNELVDEHQIVINSAPSSLDSAETQPVRVHYFVKVGDTLSDIFSAWGIPYLTLQEILSADLESLQLDMIKPGEYLELIIDSKTRALLALTYHISLVEQAIYTLEEGGKFAYEFKEIESEWRETLYSGTINGSFSVSAHKLGFSSTQVANITRILRDKINFSRSLRAGDRFNVWVNQQYLGDHPTGTSEIQAVSFQLGSREVAAFLADDGRFYDREGNSLERAFNRYPVDSQYRRITSSFNPKRKHPVTGRVSPHNGTDFATPVGAPVYSTGDGRVVGVRNHPYAGKYLIIEHNSVYKTRYLHLHKFLVKKGQQVKRGQKIAISGATGRLTGPHLHFEVLVRNRPVDPMKADLPISSSISGKDKAAFNIRVSKFDSLISEGTSSDT